MDKTSEEYFKSEMLSAYSVTPQEITMMTFLGFDPKTGSLRYLDCMYTLIVTTIMWFQYGVMIYCGWNMYSKMEEKLVNLSATLRRHHKQLFKTLVFQNTVPTIFLFSPSVLMLYLPYFRIEISFPAGAVICAFSFFPAIDSIIVLCIVTEYRLAAKKLWSQLFKKSYLTSTVSLTSGAQSNKSDVTRTVN